MKYCVSCGKEIKESAKFCPFCGATQPGMDTNPPSRELANKSRNYFNFLNQNVAHPQVGLTSDRGFFGLLNFSLVTLLLSLALSHGFARGFNLVAAYTGNFPVLFELILWLGGCLFALVAVNFFAARLAYQEAVSFLESFDRIFAPASLAVYVSLALLLFSLIVNPGTMLLFLLIFGFCVLLVNLSFYGNLWRNEDLTTQRNRYYVNVIAILIQWCLTALVSWIFLTLIFEKIGSTFETFLNQLFSF